MTPTHPKTRTLRIAIHVLTIAVFLASFFWTALPVQADALEVTNTNNSGEGSLRWAIDQANASPGADTITFSETLNTQTINVYTGAAENNNAAGDLDILLRGDLTITGNGPTNTIIQSDGNQRVIHICPADTCFGTGILTIDGVTIQGGDDTTGGGLAIQGSTTTLVDTIVWNNNAGWGGGIWNEGTLNIQGNSEIKNNTAETDGGGMINMGEATVISSTISSNHAFNGGGILNNYGGSLSLQNTVVKGNTADNGGNLGNGGGIYHNGDSLLVENGSTIGAPGAGNHAEKFGGGIYIQDGAGLATIQSSSVITNTATNGGGIYNDEYIQIFPGSLIGAPGLGNRASISGGGIMTKSDATTVVQSSTITANRAGSGGGIFNEGTTYISGGSTVHDNTAINDGGGIYNMNDLNIMSYSVIGGYEKGNHAGANGGGIYHASGDTDITESSILNNTATEGGGLYHVGDNPVATQITNSCIVGNSNFALYNAGLAEQNASSNWWGVSGGPTETGADTIFGAWATIDPLDAAPPWCSFKIYLPVVTR